MSPNENGCGALQSASVMDLEWEVSTWESHQWLSRICTRILHAVHTSITISVLVFKSNAGLHGGQCGVNQWSMAWQFVRMSCWQQTSLKISTNSPTKICQPKLTGPRHWSTVLKPDYVPQMWVYQHGYLWSELPLSFISFSKSCFAWTLEIMEMVVFKIF